MGKYVIRGAGKYFITLVMSAGFVSVATSLYSQNDRQHIREGNRDYRAGKFGESELAYRRATDLPKSTADAWFNLGNAIYRQQRFEDAAATFEKNASQNDDAVKKANSYYNQGNALLGSQKLQESIEAYKKSLRLNPDNMEAKYNLAYAQDLLQEQEEQQQQNQNQDQDKNEDDQNQNQDQQNQQQQNPDQDKSDENQQQQQQQESGEQKITLKMQEGFWKRWQLMSRMYRKRTVAVRLILYQYTFLTPAKRFTSVITNNGLSHKILRFHFIAP